MCVLGSLFEILTNQVSVDSYTADLHYMPNKVFSGAFSDEENTDNDAICGSGQAQIEPFPTYRFTTEDSNAYRLPDLVSGI